MSHGADFEGSVVVVTGAGRLGQSAETVSHLLARQGAHVVLTGRHDALLRERAAEMDRQGMHASVVACDLLRPADVETLVAHAADVAPSGLRGLVNLAGGFESTGPVASTDPLVWKRVFDINLATAFFATRALVPLLRQARGAIVFFAAAAALPGAAVHEMAAYAAAKGAVITLMRAVAAEERTSGVRANALAPTAIRTASNLARMGEKTAYVEREKVAEWTQWLLSRSSGPASGQVIRLG